MSDTFVYAEKDLVRVRGWGNLVFRVVRINGTQGTVDLWGGSGSRASTRTVTSDRIMPAKPGDVARAPYSFPMVGKR